ncbi:hypothetical protein [Corynebacterium sp. TAE3-ERU16]|uniref:hypothetical protein n=1 Tax=Corynebacterium sp. TAE3-ERU16 TaxID=2849493 RepID=UPI001C482D3C|nr:hypothetical protein [Corynebacterium sp. TAE3-ERU16]MBV7292469.1 hypothetical protein [Corynebacterium sp. TAE3-ERU16]
MTAGILITVDGAIRGRLPVAQTITVRIDERIPSGTYSRTVRNKSAPCLKIDRNILQEIRSVLFRRNDRVIEFTHRPDHLPKTGSGRWRRPHGKGCSTRWVREGGWVIAALVLLLLIGRIIETILDWIIELPPDVGLPWPDHEIP